MRSFVLVMVSSVLLNSAALAGEPLANQRPQFTPQSRIAQSQQREEIDRWQRIQALQARREREEIDRWRRIQTHQARRERAEIDRWRRIQTHQARREREAQQDLNVSSLSHTH
jgi:hypothetical protein